MPERGKVTHSKERTLLLWATGLRFRALKTELGLLVRDHLPELKKATIRFWIRMLQTGWLKPWHLFSHSSGG